MMVVGLSWGASLTALVASTAVLYGLGNLFVGVLCLVYVRLIEVCPAWFLSR